MLGISTKGRSVRQEFEMAREPQAVKNPQEARQAEHAGVKNVLIGGLVLVVLAFAAVYFLMK